MLTKIITAVLLVALLVSAAPLDGLAMREGGSRNASLQRSSSSELRAAPDKPVVAPDEEQDGHHNHHRTTDGDVSASIITGDATCDEDINRTGRAYRMQFTAAVNNGQCDNTDLDVYQVGTRSFVVQGAAYRGAYTHYEVTNPARPVVLRRHKWATTAALYTRVQDIQHFRRGTRQYIALALERSRTAGYCGVVIIDVTSPKYPVKKSQHFGSNWCDTHNLFVEKDGNGNGLYIYVAANYTKDMRVLDISGTKGGSVWKPKEIGRYRNPKADPYGPGYGSNRVHDIHVATHPNKGRRVYISYWRLGVIILNAAKVTPGVNPTPIIKEHVIDYYPFRAHHAVPNSAGTRLFIQDEFLYSRYDEPVQMWDIGGPFSTHPPHYIDGVRPNVGVNGQLTPAHTLYVMDDFIYVGWYKAGLQGYGYVGEQGFTARQRYHQVQIESTDNVYDGAWAVERLVINGVRYMFQSDQRYGLIVSKVL